MIEMVEHFAAMSAAAAGSSSSLITLRSIAVAARQQQSRNDRVICGTPGRIRGAAAQQSHKSSSANLRDLGTKSKDYFYTLGAILSESNSQSYPIGILARLQRWPRKTSFIKSNRLQRASKIFSLRNERENDTKLSEEERPRMNVLKHSEDSNGSCLSKALNETRGHSSSMVEDLLPKLDAVVVEAAEIVAETVEVAVQTVSSVGEIEGQIPAEQSVVDREAAVRTVGFWVCAAVAFGFIIGLKDGSGKASEFFAGYLVEQSLSVDNLFVFVLIFKYFRVPIPFQSRVLTYGIFGAIIFRATMILLGVVTLQSLEVVNLLFAGVLLFSSYKILSEGDDEEADLSNNYIVSTCRKFIPVTASYDGNNFFTASEGIRKATPLLLTLAVVEFSDIVFAVDSIPAVFGVTRDPFIVFSSNIFAILGLRSLYTLISGSMDELEYLQPSVALVLGFIGSKMVMDFFGFHVPTEFSLALVVSILGAGVSLSLLKKGENE